MGSTTPPVTGAAAVSASASSSSSTPTPAIPHSATHASAYDTIQSSLNSTEPNYPLALKLARELVPPNPALVTYILQSQFLSTSSSDLSPEFAQNTLDEIQDDEWVAKAISTRTGGGKKDELPRIDVVERLLEIGLERTKSARDSAIGYLRSLSQQDPEAAEDTETSHSLADLEGWFSANSKEKTLCHLRELMIIRKQKLQDYKKVFSDSLRQETGASTRQSAGINEVPAQEDSDEDDPWGETSSLSDSDHDSGSIAPAKPSGHTDRSSSCITLAAFLSHEPLEIALDFATNIEAAPLVKMMQVYHFKLWRHRFAILEALPIEVLPEAVKEILPAMDTGEKEEWKAEDQIMQGVEKDDRVLFCIDDRVDSSGPTMSVGKVTSWYQRRIEDIEAAGLIDVALAWSRMAVSIGIVDLLPLEQDLESLSKLVYGTARPELSTAASPSTVEWSLTQWRISSPSQIVSAYLKNSVLSRLADDIRDLVIPYLQTLVDNAEKCGKPDPGLIDRELQHYVLTSSLSRSLAIFEASKATMPQSQRIIKNDLDVARLALARLYGSDEIYDWPTMSKIFECLPVWDVSSEESVESDREITTTTLESLAAFVTPSPDRPTPPGPEDMMLFFKPLPFVSLSRALDILDVHLESGEILARWNVPAPLRTFLQTAFDKDEQRSWATRMARLATSGPRAGGLRFDHEDEWISLMDDMIKLSGGGEGLLRGAFGLLDTEEVLKIFFSGLLSAGRFSLAKSLLNSSEIEHPLGPGVVESLVLQAEREFYDNASSGNMHTGEMKMAYDCLSVAPTTQAIRREREFIEATSRISSFQVKSSSGDPLSPLEIRLVKDRLELIRKVVSGSEDAYRHLDVIIDLAGKLGFRDDLAAEIQVLGMLADSAMDVPDYDYAVDICKKMVEDLQRLNKDKRRTSEEAVKTAREVCWKTCSQLGKQSEYSDVETKLKFLGRALELCPPEDITGLLVVWRRVEEGHIRLQEAARHRKEAHIPEPLESHMKSTRSMSIGSSSSSASKSREQALLGSRTAARAAQSLGRVARDIQSSGFSLRPLVNTSGHPSPRPRTEHSPADSERSSIAGSIQLPDYSQAFSGIGSDGQEIKQQARKALVKGVGWLLGAAEDEIGDL